MYKPRSVSKLTVTTGRPRPGRGAGLRHQAGDDPLRQEHRVQRQGVQGVQAINKSAPVGADVKCQVRQLEDRRRQGHRPGDGRLGRAPRRSRPTTARPRPTATAGSTCTCRASTPLKIDSVIAATLKRARATTATSSTCDPGEPAVQPLTGIIATLTELLDLVGGTAKGPRSSASRAAPAASSSSRARSSTRTTPARRSPTRPPARSSRTPEYRGGPLARPRTLPGVQDADRTLEPASAWPSSSGAIVVLVVAYVVISGGERRRQDGRDATRRHAARRDRSTDDAVDRHERRRPPRRSPPPAGAADRPCRQRPSRRAASRS